MSTSSNLVGITPTEYATIQFSSCFEELSSLPNSGVELWDTLTQSAFAQISSSIDAHPFIACNYNTNISGFKRKMEIENILDDATFSEFPLYNGDDKTCYLVQASGQTISEAITTDEVKIQPLLPMMKLGDGILKTCRELFGDGNSGVPARIVAMLGPGVASDKEHANSVGRSILERINGAVMGVALRETFPSSGNGVLTGLNGEKLEKGFFDSIMISSSRRGDQITFEIGGQSRVSHAKMLAFLAGVASQPEVTMVDVAKPMQFH